jgi:hypothetical protein
MVVIITVNMVVMIFIQTAILTIIYALFIDWIYINYNKLLDNCSSYTKSNR